MQDQVEVEDFKAAMASFASGVTLITTTGADGTPLGLTATAFSSVCKEPPTCFVCVARSAEAHDSLLASGRFAVNVLPEDEGKLSELFAQSGANKFSTTEWHPGPVLGCPTLPTALARLECAVTTHHSMGDHTALYGLLRSVSVRPGAPLVYFRGAYTCLA